ncbi:hypothetical protein GCM10009527_009260 [Actinomadura nitritigenes]|uniref:Uncharacterized protein n=1 Tax=Actinomadura nitritigenes TaxID=134602 RepID=A0ABS3R168_9ACTN|nr:hypothetical protein [Actinomadura nitritigenes]MBO2439805.1 hypothetical protein [Actinomadura nitritigenes]
MRAEDGVRRRVQRFVPPANRDALTLGAVAIRLARRLDAGDPRAVEPLRVILRQLPECSAEQVPGGVDEQRARAAQEILARLLGRVPAEG